MASGFASTVHGALSRCCTDFGIKPLLVAKYISWFRDIGLDDRPKVGGKGGSLGELHRAGINVPPGFVVRTEAFEGFVEALERGSPVRARLEGLAADDLEGMGVVSRELRTRIEDAPLPADLQQEIRDAYGRLGGSGPPPAVAVRSSATTEDAADASFAGLQDTYLWVAQADSVMRKIRSCWASLYSLESLSYRRRHGIAESTVAMAVVVQTMVDARTAGVMFTRSPISGDRSVIAIEGAWGLGSALVSGEVTPDRWVVAKITGEISVREISDKAIRHAQSPAGGVEELPVEESLRREACLSDEELESLRAIGRQVERHYGRPQDIEWAIDRHTQRILLLQSRPETVWSNKDNQTAATRVSDPLLHVMNIFGGKR
jgi:pyruvate,water dikinase